MLRVLFALVSICGCGDDDGAAPDGGPPAPDTGPRAPDAGPRDWPAGDIPAVTEPEEGIVREVVRVPGGMASANPATGAETPAELSFVQVVRWRAAGDAPQARAVIVAMPGFLGGAPSWEPLARALVRRAAAAGEPIEVWGIDRRANLLEDLAGMDAAEALGDPEVAQGYYFGADTVGGARFAGFHAQEDVSFMSEWGMALHFADLLEVIRRVPDAEQRTRVFLMGHSFGGWMTEMFAAWRFGDGTRGAERLAGMILVDAAVGGAPITETQYHEGTGGGLMMVPGVDAIRGGRVYTALPLLGLDVYPRAEIMALRALLAPDAVVADRGRDEVLATLFSVATGRIPDMSNEAALGFAFDDESALLSFAAVSAGHSTGGPLEEFMGLTGTMLVRPSDPAATYTWIDANEDDPPEHTPIASLAHTWVDGRTNFAEWYFPTRLTLDAQAIGDSHLAEDSWQASEGLRAFDGALIDAPILCIAAALTRPAAYVPIAGRVAPIGAGRPHAGAARDDPAAFRIVDAPTMTHIDPLTADDRPDNVVIPAIEAFVADHAATATIPLPTTLD